MSGFEILAAVGTAVSAGGSILGGVQAASASRSEAQAQKIAAKEERAAAQIEADRKRRETSRVISRQMAVAADSGGDVADPTVLKLMSDVAGEGEMQERQIMYEGDARATSRENNAAALRALAGQQSTAGFINAGSSILSGFTDWSRYSGAAPKSATADYRTV